MAIKEITVMDQSEEERKLDDNMKLLKNLRTQNIVDINMVRIFVIIWLSACVLTTLPVFRPDYSEVEKRELTKFPKFSFSTLV